MYKFQTLLEIQSDIDEGKITLPELVNEYLSVIEKKSHLNAFLEVYKSESLERAQLIQKKINEKTAGRLAGMVIGVKDNIAYKSHIVSSGSRVLELYNSPFSATSIQNLLDEDAIIIGRTNCDEFGMGSSNENSAFGACLNPIDESRVSGGSSGGSAAAVAANLCHAALGSDTGGSVRQPSSYCGLVGVKPTYGQISRHGLIAYASSFDQIGPITHSVEDAELLIDVMAKDGSFDATKYSNSSSENNGDFSFAIIEESLDERTQPEVRQSILQLESDLKNKGHRIKRIKFSLLEYIVPTYYVLTMAEASSNLARYDGIQYGFRSMNDTNVIEMVTYSRSQSFGDEVKRRIMMGNFVLSQEFADAYYNKAQKVRNKIIRQTQKILMDFDFIITPTSPTTAFRLNEENKDPLTMYLLDVFTVQANLTGLPAISLPLFKDTEEMPIGIQFLTKAFSEQKLYKLGKYLYQ